MCSELSASSPVARDHWEIFELIIKENGDKGSDGKGRKSEAITPIPSLTSHHSPPITPRSRSTLVPIIPLSRFSRAREFPYPHLALGKPVEEAGELFLWVPQLCQIFAYRTMHTPCVVSCYFGSLSYVRSSLIEQHTRRV